MNKPAVAILSALFLCGGLYIWWDGLLELRALWAAQGWQAASCRIEESRVELGRRPQARRPAHVFRVRYTYERGGRNWTGDRVHPYATDLIYGETARALAALYPAGSRARCFVNPSEPSESALDNRLWFSDLKFMVAGLLFVGAGIAGLMVTVGAWALRRFEPPPWVVRGREALPDVGMRAIAVGLTGMGLGMAADAWRDQQWLGLWDTVWPRYLAAAALAACGLGLGRSLWKD